MKKQTLTLKVIEAFRCLGSECPRDCCHDWDRIVVDKNTLEKWKATQDSEAKEYLLGSVGTAVDGVVHMKTTEDLTCAALNKEKLCRIQIKYGHDYLSELCRNFPRKQFDNSFRSYHAASFSCPEIVEKVLFFDNDKPMFTSSERDESIANKNQQLIENEKILYALDELLNETLEKSNFTLGVILFLISDMFSNIIGMLQSGQLSEDHIRELRLNIDTYLTDISADAKRGKLKPHPVTAGSFWKRIYELCESRKVEEKYLDASSSILAQSIRRCDDSFPAYSKVYTAIKQYRKKGNKQLKQQLNTLLRKYVKISFVNKGFPLDPPYALDLLLVDCMINFCVLQLLIWIEINKNARLSNQFLKDCIVEVDRKFFHHSGVTKQLQKDPHMMQIQNYCPTFLDLF